MKRSVLAFMVAASLVALATSAPAADSSISSMNRPFLTGTSQPPLAPPLSAAWTNGTSRGKTKVLGSCKILVKLSGVALPDSDGVPGSGDEVLCLIDLDSTFVDFPQAGGPLGFVLRGEVRGGTVRCFANLFAEGAVSFFCANHVVHNLRSTCYEPDPAYAPILDVPFYSDGAQGLIEAYPPRPATGLIAADSVFFP